MGGCQWQCPTPLTNDPSWPLNQVKNVQYACSDIASTPRSNMCPQNGEWQAVNAGSCQYDSLQNGCECTTSGCDAGHCAIAGARTGCQRISYGADRLQCCLQNATTIGSQTCDPAYRGTAQSACQSLLQSHCDNATNFFTPQCQEWLKNNTTAVRDTLAFKHCPGSPDHPFCACYNAEIPPSWLGDPIKEAIFRCLDPKCQAPQALKPHEFNCPTSYADCTIKETEFNSLDSDVQLNMQNLCGSIIFEDQQNPPTPTPNPGPGPSPPGSVGGLSLPALIGIGAGALVLIIIIIMVMVGLSKKSKKVGGGRYKK